MLRIDSVLSVFEPGERSEEPEKTEQETSSPLWTARPMSREESVGWPRRIEDGLDLGWKRTRPDNVRERAG